MKSILKRTSIIISVLLSLVLLCSCGAKVSDMSVATLKQQEDDLSLTFEKEEDGERIYKDEDYKPSSLGSESEVTVIADDDNHIKKIEIDLEQGTVDGLEELGDTTFEKLIAGSDSVKFGEDAKTATFFASWTYSPFIEQIFTKKDEKKEWDQTTYEELADGVSIGDWKIYPEGDDDDFKIIVEAN